MSKEYKKVSSKQKEKWAKKIENQDNGHFVNVRGTSEKKFYAQNIDKKSK